MHFSDAIDAIAKAVPDDFSSLSEVLSPELIDTCLEEAGVATLRKRRLPLDMVVWAVVGMALFRHIPMGQIVNHLDIMLPASAPSSRPAPWCRRANGWGSNRSNASSSRPRRCGTSRRHILTGAG